VVDELRAIWTERIIETEFNFAEPVVADTRRIAQVLSNLLGNALTHGQKDTPVKVQVTSADGVFELSVTNHGTKISTEAMARLFHPFSRGEVKSHQEGLGLGLYIASEIARAHGGTLDVVSTDEQTCFALRMPSQQEGK